MKALVLVTLSMLGGHQHDIPSRLNSIYYHDPGVDLSSWTREALTELNRRLSEALPSSAHHATGHTAVGVVASRDGSIIASETIVRSGVPSLVAAAERAFKTTLPPLPSGYPAARFEFIAVVWLNEDPYDIFDERVDEVLERLRRSASADASGDDPKYPLGRDLKVKHRTVIYAEPTGTSERLSMLDEDETVHVVANADGDFWEVRYQDVRGFVHDLLLKKPVAEKPTRSADAVVRSWTLAPVDIALLAAAADGNEPSLEQAIESGASLECRDEYGRTPLILAARAGRRDAARALLDAGARASAEDLDGWSALAHAEAAGNGDMVDLLLDHGAEWRNVPVAERKEMNDSDKAWAADPVPRERPPDPAYPKRAREALISGEVILKIKVLTDGSTEVQEVLKPLLFCTDRAKEHAREWKWKPAEKDGRPVEASGIITVSFDVFVRR